MRLNKEANLHIIFHIVYTPFQMYYWLLYSKVDLSLHIKFLLKSCSLTASHLESVNLTAMTWNS